MVCVFPLSWEWPWFHEDRSNFPINTPSGFLRSPETDDFRRKILVYLNKFGLGVGHNYQPFPLNSLIFLIIITQKSKKGGLIHGHKKTLD